MPEEKPKYPKFKSGEKVFDGFFKKTWTVMEQRGDQVYVIDPPDRYRFRAIDLKSAPK